MHERTRRQFLRGAIGGAAAGGALGLLGRGVCRAVSPEEGDGALPPFPLEEVVESFQKHQLRTPLGWRATGTTRDAYLEVAEAIVRAFLPHQDARGAIIDPYEKRERQYATPAFALAAAAPAVARERAELLEPAMRAMEVAAADLAAGRAADGHADFFTVLLMHADRLLARRAPAARRAAWQTALAAVVPEKIYRAQPGNEPVSNWNLVAASGEWMRHSAGLAPDAAWVEASLARQRPLFTANGMYRDPGCPMAYDHFARLHAGILLGEGYRGPLANDLTELLDRGAWASLLMQSSRGELPTGGRSGMHQWNEAMQAVTFEATARRLVLRGEHRAAGAFKRAARLSLESVRRWVRPSGDLWIVKNRFDPAQRHGYEPYSFHSQYNLLAAAHLTLAYLAAEDRIAEGPCPAEVGGYAFALEPVFHKTFLNALGHYVEVETAADLGYNPTGIVRIHHPKVESQWLADGVAPACAYEVPRAPAQGLALGPAWRDGDGVWHALADHGADATRDVSLSVNHVAPDRVECEIVWRGALRGGAALVRQTFFLKPTSLTLTTTVEGEIFGVRLLLPLLLNDGRDASRVEVSGRRASARTPRGSGFAYEVGGMDTRLARLNVEEAARAGVLDAAYVETAGRSVRCVVRPA